VQKSNLKCQACGGLVCSVSDAVSLVGKMNELYETSFINVWHPDCAVNDGRIDSVKELDGDEFYYEIRE